MEENRNKSDGRNRQTMGIPVIAAVLDSVYYFPMNDISVLQDVDPEVLQALCRDSTDDISKALTTTNAATAIGLLKQVSTATLFCRYIVQVSQHCKSVLDGIKDRMYDINKRIGTAQKSVKGYQQRIAEKQQVYNSFTIETQVDESVGWQVCIL